MIRSWTRHVLTGGAILFLTFGAPAWAHEQRNAGDITMRVGWLNEPAYTGSVNAIQVELSRGGTAVPNASLDAVVLFGDKNSTTKSAPLTLAGSDETAGTFTAPLVPTRPGTYTFHISGTAGSTKVDQFFTSGEKTFDDITDPTTAEFPVKDPTTPQLAQRIASADAAATKASSEAKRGTIALIVGAAGVVIGLVALVRRRA